MDLRTDVTILRDWHVVSIFGDLDVATAPSLRERLLGLLADGADHVVIDLDGVDFLDSTGLGTIVSALKRCRTADGDLRLVCSQDRLLRLFQITGLDKALTIRPTLDEALAEG